jgi:adenylate cyclase
MYREELPIEILHRLCYNKSSGTLKTEAGEEDAMGGERNLQSARDRLRQTQRELDLIVAIDHIRDTLPEPSAMLTAIVSTLADHLRADLCLLCLMDGEAGKLECKAVSDKGGWFRHIDPTVTQELARRVIEVDDVVTWQADEWSAIPGRPGSSLFEDHPAMMYLAVIPITLPDGLSSGGDLRLGALLAARGRAPFEQDDVALLRAAESQIDSAVRQAHDYYELQQRNLELETIYRVDRIRDQNLPFDEMLSAVVQELCAVIQAEMGFIMLYDRAGRRLELRASTRDDLLTVAPYYDLIDRFANQALQQGHMVCHNDLGDVLHSVMCVPLILHDEIIGVLGVVNRYGPGGFDVGDSRLLSAIASQMDTAIFESLELVRLRQVLGRSVDPHVMERLLANPNVGFLKGERAVLTVLYADIRGSTSLAEHTDPEQLVGFINDYLSRMTEVIFSHQGTLDKFVGDEVMALFGAPFPQPDHALRAVRVGLEMQKAHQEVMKSWQAQKVEAAPIGIGIATGEMTVGEMGSAQRSDYSVIGRAANLGARICAVARAGQVLISQATYDLVREQVAATPITDLDLKGLPDDVTAYHVTRILE